ncbi:oxepin-CoA hydrolase, alternative type [Caballeronia ptereochthonis]|uniref:Enoyl-CoA hydratase n=1 Tax=Caballeronia ptereochthonis TaxID=1777144 RepID=A0A158BDP7_9BURK|nr:enoyl-CoA hydratase [Caballeronia ptereochthonis]SAK68020.1 enoyl-CoA hydratase [Caballeronia ptereochthonis]
MNEAILSRREGAVQVLSMNNPSARNALTAETYTALPAALAKAERDPDVGAIVLTGAGGVFCAGGDLNRLAQRRAMTPTDRRAGVEVLHTMIRAIRDCSKPVIAAVEGAAAGAGLSIALACDLLVAARNASFSVAYVKVGLSPDAGATAFLSGCVSRQLLTELCLLGKPVTGERMHALGVANRLTEPEGALAEAIAMAQLLAAGPERAIARIKSLCRHAGENTLDAQLDLEADYMTESLGDDESAEGIGAFFGKRPADYAALRRGAAVQSS